MFPLLSVCMPQRRATLHARSEMLSAAKAEVAAKLAAATAPAEEQRAARESNHATLQVGHSRLTASLARHKEDLWRGSVEQQRVLQLCMAGSHCCSFQHRLLCAIPVVWVCRPHDVVSDGPCPRVQWLSTMFPFVSPLAYPAVPFLGCLTG